MYPIFRITFWFVKGFNLNQQCTQSITYKKKKMDFRVVFLVYTVYTVALYTVYTVALYTVYTVAQG